MEAVVRNTMVQGVLSILFVVLAIIVIFTAVQATLNAYRNKSSSTSEDPAVRSRMFAPAGFLPTPAEKAISAEWDALPVTKKPRRSGH